MSSVLAPVRVESFTFLSSLWYWEQRFAHLERISLTETKAFHTCQQSEQNLVNHHILEKSLTTSDASLFMYCALKSRFHEVLITYFLFATMPTKIRLVIASDVNYAS